MKGLNKAATIITKILEVFHWVGTALMAAATICSVAPPQLLKYLVSIDAKELQLPLQSKVKRAFVYDTKQPLKMKRTKEGVTLLFDETPSGTDYIVELELRD